MTTTSTVAPPDSPEVRKYNRIRRWLGIGDLVLALCLLLLLLLTGWTGAIRDLAYSNSFQSYNLAVFLYVFFLILIARILGKHPHLTPFQVKAVLHAVSDNAT